MFLRIFFGLSEASLAFYHCKTVAGSVIQATGTVEYEDGLRTGVLQKDSWCPYSGRATLESDMARPWRPALTQV